jgi:hypothetical protein
LVLGRSLSSGSGYGSVYGEGIGVETVTGRFAEVRFCSSSWNGDICGRCEAVRSPRYSTDVARAGCAVVVAPIIFACTK